MADFTIAANWVLSGGLVNEGGYEPPSAADPGGETKYGISKRAYPQLTIATLTPEDAQRIYRKDFWRFDAVRDQDVASKLLDMTVNHGLSGGVRLAQRALTMFFPNQGAALDGVFGSETTARVNECDPSLLLCELRARCVQKYIEDLQARPQEAPLAMGLWRRAVK